MLSLAHPSRSARWATTASLGYAAPAPRGLQAPLCGRRVPSAAPPAPRGTTAPREAPPSTHIPAASKCTPYTCSLMHILISNYACISASVYCPSGSPYPLFAEPGYFTTPDSSAQLPCPPGSYCMRGVAALCAGGSFSSAPGAAACEGVCSPGTIRLLSRYIM